MTEEEINQFFLDNRTKSADTNLSDVYDDSANAPTFYGSTLPVNKVAQNLQSNSRLYVAGDIFFKSEAKINWSSGKLGLLKFIFIPVKIELLSGSSCPINRDI